MSTTQQSSTTHQAPTYATAKGHGGVLPGDLYYGRNGKAPQPTGQLVESVGLTQRGRLLRLADGARTHLAPAAKFWLAKPQPQHDAHAKAAKVAASQAKQAATAQAQAQATQVLGMAGRALRSAMAKRVEAAQQPTQETGTLEQADERVSAALELVRGEALAAKQAGLSVRHAMRALGLQGEPALTVVRGLYYLQGHLRNLDERLRLLFAPPAPKPPTKAKAAKRATPQPAPEGEWTCTGDCGQLLPMVKFPTTSVLANGRMGRGTECRSCRDARKARGEKRTRGASQADAKAAAEAKAADLTARVAANAARRSSRTQRAAQ